jgi:hypothetical protein
LPKAAGPVINIRKLVALDLVLLGSKYILGEYGGVVFFSIAIGIFGLLRGRSFWQVALGVYLICVGINHMPMLVYAVAITRKQSARAEVAEELTHRRQARSKYRRQSLLTLVPLLVPVLVVARLRQKS